MQTKTIRIRKVYVFAALFIIILAITFSMVKKTFNVYEEALPDPLEDTSDIELIQLSEPSEELTRAVISTTAGDITVVLYENEAPNAVSIFRDNAAQGNIDGVNIQLYELGTVFTLDVPDRAYEAELHKNLWPFKGALCMNETGDLIFINTVEFSDEDREYLSSEGELSEVRRAFLEHGGVPNYSRQFAVFGQVTEGMDVLEKIASSPVSSVITVNSVTIQ